MIMDMELEIADTKTETPPLDEKIPITDIADTKTETPTLKRKCSLIDKRIEIKIVKKKLNDGIKNIQRLKGSLKDAKTEEVLLAKKLKKKITEELRWFATTKKEREKISHLLSRCIVSLPPIELSTIESGASCIKTFYPEVKEQEGKKLFDTFLKRINENEPGRFTVDTLKQIYKSSVSNRSCDDALNNLEACITNYWSSGTGTSWVDPECSDRILVDIIMSEYGGTFMIKDTKGEGYEWNLETALWLPMKEKQTRVLIQNLFKELITKRKIRFTDPKEEKLFLKNINTNRVSKNLVEVLSGLRFNTQWKLMNNKEDELPLRDGRKINFRSLGVNFRDKTDLFSVCTDRMFIREGKCEVPERYKDVKNSYERGELIETFKTFASQPEYYNEVMPHIDDMLRCLYPNAYAFLSTSHPDLEGRMWIGLRLGLSLTCSVKDRSIYFLYGPGSGGKTKILEATDRCLGEGFACLVNKMCVVKGGMKRSSDHDAHLVPLVGKRFVWVNETARHDQINSSDVKLLAAGEQSNFRGMYGDNKTNVFHCKVWVATNFPLVLDPSDIAIQDRLRAKTSTVRFWTPEHPFKPDNWNAPDYEDYVDTERKITWIRRTKALDTFCDKMKVDEKDGGFLNEWFSLLSLYAYYAFKIIDSPVCGTLPIPPIIQRNTLEFFAESDEVQDFINTHCVLQSTWRKGNVIGTVFKAFTQYQKANETKCWPLKRFREVLASKGLYAPDIWRSKDGRHTMLTVINDRPILNFIQTEAQMPDHVPDFAQEELSLTENDLTLLDLVK